MHQVPNLISSLHSFVSPASIYSKCYWYEKNVDGDFIQYFYYYQITWSDSAQARAKDENNQTK